MDINIRNSIIENFKNSSHDDLHQTINDAISSTEEKTLPGLGVFLELIWSNSSAEFRKDLVDKLSTSLKK